MRLFFLLFTCLWAVSVWSQTSTAPAIFKTTGYSLDGSKRKLAFDTIKTTKVFDIHFYKSTFRKPFYLPESLSNSSYKSQEIVFWADSAKKLNFNTNWTYTYVYDEQSRLVEYRYSGCTLCSTQPFTARLFYDNKNRPIRIIQGGSADFSEKKGDKMKAGTGSQQYLYTYDEQGVIVKMDYLANGVLSEQILKTQ